MKNIEKIFSCLIEQLIWSLRRGDTGFLTMEFGRPHIQIRNPMASNSTSIKVRELAMRRRVFLTGQWSLFISSLEWSACFNGRLVVFDSAADEINKVLSCIEGQKLIKYNFEKDKKIISLEFDLGGEIKFCFNENRSDGDLSLWSLSDFNEGIIYWWNNKLDYENCIKIHPGDMSEF